MTAAREAPASQEARRDVAASRPVKVALVTNIPAPYRVPVYNRIHASGDIDLTVLYAAAVEPDRQWDLAAFEHRHEVLGGRMVERAGKFIHYNPRVWSALSRLSPDVVITTGYNPTHLLAFLWCLLHRRRHVPQTDGTLESEQALSAVHHLLRRGVIGASAAAIVAAHGGWRLMRRFGMPSERIHFSPLCANTAVAWDRPPGTVRDVDLLFSARLIPAKHPDFALRVAEAAAMRMGRRLTMVILGRGPMENAVREQARAIADRVDVQFAGHVAQAELPGWFHRARLFLFTTSADVWGVVANEAALAEVPVIVSPHAGVAGDLVRDGATGRVLPMVLEQWVDAAVEILSDPALQARMGAAARRAVEQYSFANAAAGIVDAARQAAGADRSEAPRHSTFVRRRRVVYLASRLDEVRKAGLAAVRDALAQNEVEFVTLAEPGSPWTLAIPDGPRHPGGPMAVRTPGLLELTADLILVDGVSGNDRPHVADRHGRGTPTVAWPQLESAAGRSTPEAVAAALVAQLDRRP